LLRQRGLEWDQIEVEGQQLIDFYTLEIKMAKDRENSFHSLVTTTKKEEGKSQGFIKLT
jgi:hypothetical protein